MLFNNGGGSGATCGHDGWPLCGTQAALGGDEDRVDRAARAAATRAVERWEVEPDSMGFGRVAGRAGQPHRGAAADRRDDRDHVRRRLHATRRTARSAARPGIGGGQYVEDRRRRHRRTSRLGEHARRDSAAEVVGRGLHRRRRLRRPATTATPRPVRRDVRDGHRRREPRRARCSASCSSERPPTPRSTTRRRGRCAQELRAAGRPDARPDRAERLDLAGASRCATATSTSSTRLGEATA